MVAAVNCHGERGVHSFDLDGAGSIPATPPAQMTGLVDPFDKLE